MILKISRINKRRLFRLILVLIFIFVASVGLFWFEFTGRDEALSNEYPILNFVNRLPKILDIYYLPLKLKGPDLPEYKLTIDKKDLEKLESVLPRDCCNCLPKEATKYIPAGFNYDSKDYQVGVRVRGDCSNHWSDTKKSWRIRFKDDDLFFGLKQFDLIIPVDREFIAEYLNNYRAQKLGLVVPEMKLVTVKINKDYYGAYLQQERISGEMLEKINQPGDINIYGDDLLTERLFIDLNTWQKYNKDIISPINNYIELDLLLDIINNSTDEEFFAKIPQLIDLDNFYRWNISSMLAGSYHQDFFHNMRIYFDNTVGKFKFIPSDVGLSSFSPIDIIYNPIATRILKNPEFLHARNQVLWDYVKGEENLKDDLAFFDQAYSQIRWAIYRDRKNNYSNFYFDRKIKIRRERYENLYREAQAVLGEGQAEVIIDMSKNLASQVVSLFPLARVEFFIDNFSGANLGQVQIELLPEMESVDQLSLYYDANNNKVLDSQDSKIKNFELHDSKLVANNLDFLMLAERKFPENIDYNRKDFEDGVGPLFKPVQIDTTSFTFFITGKKSPVLVELFDNLEFKLNNAITGEQVDYDKVYSGDIIN